MSQYARYPASGGGSGTVTSVGLADASTTPIFDISGSPVTSSGTLTLALKTESAHTVLIGPSSGSPAEPTFRLLLASDIPSLSYVTNVTASAPLSSSGGSTPNITITESSSISDGYLSSADWNTFNNKQPAGAYITALTGDATASGPGSAALTLATVATPGTATKITFNAKGLVTSGTSAILASADFANQGTATQVLHGNAAGNPSWSAVSLTTDVSGALPIANGGTGQTTKATGFDALSPMTTKGDLIGFSTLGIRVPVGTDGQVLTADSTQTSGIKWATSAASGTVTSVAMTVPSILSVAGSPITTSGTLAVTLAVEAANTVFAGPTSGSPATPTFRTLGASEVSYSPATSTNWAPTPPAAVSAALDDIAVQVGNYTPETANFSFTSNVIGLAAVDASGGVVTGTLPSASGAAGQQFKCLKIDSTFTQITVTDGGSFSTTLNTQGELLVVISDGTNWIILSRSYPTGETAYTPFSINGFGTPTNITGFWKRNGDGIEMRGDFIAGSVTNTIATFQLPTGLTITTGLTGVDNELVGDWASQPADSISAFPHSVIAEAGAASVGFGWGTASSSLLDLQNGANLVNPGDRFNFYCHVKVAGWVA